jgi:hypothetical protein
MRITELFAPGKEWKWSFRGSEEAVAVFRVGEVPYMFHAYGANGEWEVEFKRHGSKLARMQKFGLIGTGNSVEVMSTVVDIMRAFLTQYKDKVTTLVFSAKEDSRQALYARMVKRLLPSWKMHQEDNMFILKSPDTIDVNEAFTSQVPYTIVRSGNDLFTTKATIKNREVVFSAASYEEGSQGDIVWEIDFYEKAPGIMTFGKSGAGGEMQVFSFVINSFRELIARYQPETIRFSSHKADENRSKLYHRMLVRIAPSLGYQLADVISGTADDIFVIKKVVK